MGHGVRPVGVSIPQCCAIVIEFDPFGQTREPMAGWDAEVRNAPIVDHVSFGSLFKGLLILEDSFLKPLNLLCKSPVLDCCVSLTVGDCCEESICNSAKELSVDVQVCGEHGLSGPQQHGWRC